MKIQQTFDPVVHLLKNMHKACCLLCEKYAQSVLFIRAVVIQVRIVLNTPRRTCRKN